MATKVMNVNDFRDDFTADEAKEWYARNKSSFMTTSQLISELKRMDSVGDRIVKVDENTLVGIDYSVGFNEFHKEKQLYLSFIVSRG